MPELIAYKNKWLCSYETLRFDTPDGDLDVEQYALDGEGTGYFIRTKPKSEAQFEHVDLDYDITGLKKVKIATGKAYYDEFLTALGATALYGEKQSVLPSGSIIRLPSTAKKYWDTAQIKDHPQPIRTELVATLPPPEPPPDSPEHHSIGFDATSNSGAQASVSSYSWSHTCAGDNRLLVVGDSHSTQNLSVSSATYNSVGMTIIREDERSISTLYFTSTIIYLVAPATGENTVVVNLEDTVTKAIGGAISYTGAAQTGQPDANNGANGNSTPATVAVTTIADNCWVVSAVVVYNRTMTSDNTQRWNLVSGTTYGGGSDTNAPKTPAGSQTMSWTLQSAIYWAISAASFAPATGGPTNVLAVTDTLALSENTAAVRTNRNVLASVKQMVVSALAASVVLSVNVQTTTDALACTPQAATIKVDTNVQASYDALLLVSYNATVNAETNITAGINELALTENTATVKVDRNVLAEAASLALTEQSAVVNAETNVLANTDALSLTESAANINVEISITAGVDNLSITEYSAGVNARNNVQVGLAVLAVTEQAATIKIDRNILASLDALTITPQSVVINAETSIAARVNALSLTENAATVNAETNIQADTDALTLTAYQSTVELISAGVEVLADTVSLTIMVNRADIAFDRNVLANIASLVLSPKSAFISYGGVARQFVAKNKLFCFMATDKIYYRLHTPKTFQYKAKHRKYRVAPTERLFWKDGT